jgi:SAM-dependent methyltransferase
LQPHRDSTESADEAARDAASNRALWTKTNAEYTDRQALDAWRTKATWGMFEHPESELQVLGDVAGLDAVELGCGTAYVSAWLARLGARPVGVDITPAQLETARRCMRETGIEFPLVEADGGATGLPDACADLVVSEYGASIWVDPYRWIPETARLLRPAGRLIFLRNAPLAILCSAADAEGKVGERLVWPQRDMNRFEWDGVEFHIAHGELIDVLRANDFAIERLIELYAPEDATDHEYYDFVSAEWARKWPVEELWVARKSS